MQTYPHYTLIKLNKNTHTLQKIPHIHMQLMGHMGMIMDEKKLMCRMKKSIVANVVVT